MELLITDRVTFVMRWFGVKGECRKMYIVTVNDEKCVGCSECANNCPISLFTMEDGVAVPGDAECIGCQTCTAVCPSEAVTVDEY